MRSPCHSPTRTVAPVTGSSRGIGAAAVPCLAEDKGDVAFPSSAAPERAQQAHTAPGRLAMRACLHAGDVAGDALNVDGRPSA